MIKRIFIKKEMSTKTILKS